MPCKRDPDGEWHPDERTSSPPRKRVRSISTTPSESIVDVATMEKDAAVETTEEKTASPAVVIPKRRSKEPEEVASIAAAVAQVDKKDSEQVVVVEAPISALASELTTVGTKMIQDEMNQIWASIESVSRSLLGTKQNWDNRAVLVVDPGAKLRGIFVQLWGEDWRRTYFDLKKDPSWTRAAVLEGCLSAAIFTLIFEASVQLPWEGPKDLMLKLEGKAFFINRALQDTGVTVSHESLLWRAIAMELDNEKFRRVTIQPAATEMATYMRQILDPQLDELKVQARGKDKTNFWDHRESEIARIVFDAMVLKTRLRAAPAYYEFHWFEHKKLFSTKFMEDLCGGDGRREVLWTGMPAVGVKAIPTVKHTVAVPGKVFTKPVKEPEAD